MSVGPHKMNFFHTLLISIKYKYLVLSDENSFLSISMAVKK